MKQNNTLSLHRIRLLMQWDWALNRKKYIWEWIATFMAYFAINWFLLLTAGKTHDLDGFQAVALFSVFLLFAIFAARGLAGPVSHNETRLTFLTLPASNVANNGVVVGKSQKSMQKLLSRTIKATGLTTNSCQSAFDCDGCERGHGAKGKVFARRK